MATAYASNAQRAGKGSQWRAAVPMSSEESDENYAPEMQYSTLHSANKSSAYNNGFAHDDYPERGYHKMSRKRSIGSGPHERSVDDSAWIHRDKLAQIESKEMLDAGIRIPRSLSRNASTRSRSVNRSRSGSRRATSRNADVSSNNNNLSNSRTPSETDLASYFGDRSMSPAVPPIPAGAEHWESRTSGLIETKGFGYEEAAEEQAQRRKRSNSKPSISKIPVSRGGSGGASSSLNGAMDADSPTFLARSGSTTLSSSPEMTHQSRKRRSRSLGSQAMLEESGLPRPRTPRSRPGSVHLNNSPIQNDSSDSYSSPNQTRSPKAVGLNIKKGSTARNGSVTKGRAVSANAVKDSPSSISSTTARPKSRARPEGEAPWIATMYKPDPMLPPDQQILPTHAKKMMREQWEREGKIGNTYDKDFNLISDSDPTGGKQPPLPSLAVLREQAGQLQRSATPPVRQPSPDKQQQQRQQGQRRTEEQDETFPKPWTGDTSTPKPAASSTPAVPPPSRPAEVPEPVRAASRAGSVTYRITPTITQSSGVPPLQSRDSNGNGNGNGSSSSQQQQQQHATGPNGGAVSAASYRLQTVHSLPGTMSSGTGTGTGYGQQDPSHHAGYGRASVEQQHQQPRLQSALAVRRLDPEKMPTGDEAEEGQKKKMCCCVVM